MPYIIINEEYCKGCALCTIACPGKLVGLRDTPNRLGLFTAIFSNCDKCTGCSMCAEMCPDVAITVFKERKK